MASSPEHRPGQVLERVALEQVALSQHLAEVARLGEVPRVMRAHNAMDLTGLRFGRLLVLRRAESVAGRSRWVVRCDCCVEKTVLGGNLIRGLSGSCGCRTRERSMAAHTIHGARRRKATTSEYRTWVSMLQRCRNPRDPDYQNYGGRGIRVCESWHVFATFIADMGERPSPELSLDRIDNDGNYEPGNCRWATAEQQRANRRDSLRRRP